VPRKNRNTLHYRYKFVNHKYSKPEWIKDLEKELNIIKKDSQKRRDRKWHILN